VFATLSQPDPVIGVPLHGTGFGLTVTSSFPGPLGVGAGDGAGEGAGVGTGVGAVGEGSTLPQAAAVNAITETATIAYVRSHVLDFVAMGSPERQNTPQILRALKAQQNPLRILSTSERSATVDPP
jgi:hypothetical protein